MDNYLSNIPEELSLLDDYLKERESAYNLKSNAEAQVIWHSPMKQTEYSMVYLHGFRASHGEGNPVHIGIAEKFGFNLFLSRFDEHGINEKYPLLQLTEEKLLQSAKFAFQLGKRLGKKVILMGTSTGASLALWLAAQSAFKEHIASLILYSPLIRFYGPKHHFLTNHFFRSGMQVIPGRKYLITAKYSTFEEDQIWNKSYALQGALALGSFVQHQMQEKLFSEVQCPVFCGYYYKNSYEQDTIVAISAIKRLKKQLGTRTEWKKFVNFPGASNHVICSALLSNTVDKVFAKTDSFLKNVGSHAPRENP